MSKQRQPTFVYDAGLEPLLLAIESELVASLPSLVGRSKPADSVYALFMWYEDSSSVDYTPSFGFGTTAVLKACTKQYASDAACRCDCIWRPQQTLDNHSLIPRHRIDSPELNAKCNKAYQIMLAANKSGLPLADEGEILMPFRRMLRSATAVLNEMDWSKLIAVDEAFVVVAVDTIGNWLDDDLRACIPGPKSALLKLRGMLPV